MDSNKYKTESCSINQYPMLEFISSPCIYLQQQNPCYPNFPRAILITEVKLLLLILTLMEQSSMSKGAIRIRVPKEPGVVKPKGKLELS